MDPEIAVILNMYVHIIKIMIFTFYKKDNLISFGP